MGSDERPVSVTLLRVWGRYEIRDRHGDHGMDASCNTGTLTRGGWGSVTEMAFQITGDCQVGTEPSTWGKVKSLYGE